MHPDYLYHDSQSVVQKPFDAGVQTFYSEWGVV